MTVPPSRYPAPLLLAPIPAGASGPFLSLLHALADLDDTDRVVPCEVDPDGFYDDRRGVRALAVPLCRDCPVLTACGAYADAAGERFGVWGGRDRSAAMGRAPAGPTASA